MEVHPTILLVDDVAMFRELGAVFLSRSGNVRTASTGPEALEIARSVGPDLILVDLVMPDMDGEAVCRIVKSDPELCDIPVIIMVGADASEEWGRAVRAGADDILGKPLSRVGLIEMVNRFLRDPQGPSLPRIHLTTDAELRLGEETHHGTVRNLSRGGVFMETDWELPRQTEVGLRFMLPDLEMELHPTAKVVWQRPPEGDDQPAGMGLRFVEIDGQSVRMLDDYVLERFAEVRAGNAPAAPISGGPQ